MLMPRLLSYVLLLLYISLNVAEKVHVKNANTKEQNARKKSYASHVMSSGNAYPMHRYPEDFTPGFTFHYKTHDIPNENELSDMITSGPAPLLSKRPSNRGVSLLNIAREAASKALNGKVLNNDYADGLGLNSPFYLSKIGLKNMSITTGVQGGTYKKSLTKTIKSFKNLKPAKHENNTKRFDLPFGGMASPDLGSEVAAAQGDTGFAIPGNGQEAAGVENQILPDSSNFNMNENNVDKMMKQVDSFSQSSSTDATDNVLNHLSSYNAAEMPGDNKIMKDIPPEVQNELHSEEQALAGDDSTKRQNVDQVEANAGLRSELSDLAAKESTLSTETIKQQADIDALAQSNLNKNGVPKSSEDAELQAAATLAGEQTPVARHFHHHHHGHHLGGWGHGYGAGCVDGDVNCVNSLDCLSVDVGCHNGVHGHDDHLTNYLGGAIGGLGNAGYGAVGANGLGYGAIGAHGLGYGGVDGHALGGYGADHHVNGIGFSEGELNGHADLLNGLGGVNGLLSEHGVAAEHAGAAGIPFGAGMGLHGAGYGHNAFFGSPHHGHGHDALFAADHHEDALVHGLTHGHDFGHGGYGLGLGGFGGHHHHHGHHHHGHHLGYGIGDIDNHFANLEEDVEPVLVHHGVHGNAHHYHNHDFEPNFKFHYPTYEIPVHGDVVSEKDAKKIGLFDQAYLKKLGVWADYQAGVSQHASGGSGSGGASGIGYGSGGMAAKIAGSYAGRYGGFGRYGFGAGAFRGMGGGGGFGGGCGVPADVAFLFDVSKFHDDKIKNFKKYIEFAKRVVDFHNPSIEGYHYAAAVYSDNGLLQFDFEKSYDLAGVKNELSRIPLIGTEGKKMGEGLKTVKNQIFDRTSRDWVYKVLIVISDSDPEDDTEKPAKELWNAGVNIFALGLKYDDGKYKISKGNLDKIVTQLPDHHAFEVELENLLVAVTKDVKHPRDLASVIPNPMCRMNLVFVVDMKEEEGDDKKAENDARIKLISEFMISSTAGLGLDVMGNHAACVGYGNTKNPEEGWNLIDKRPQAQFKAAATALRQHAGKVATAGDAIGKAQEYFLDEKNKDPKMAQSWRYINMTIIITNRALDGPFKDKAEELRKHGAMIHVIGFADDAGKDTWKEAITTNAYHNDFYYHYMAEKSKLVQLARQFSLYFGQLLSGRQGLNRKINRRFKASSTSWEAHYVTQTSAVAGSSFSSRMAMSTMAGASSYSYSSSSWSRSSSSSSSSSTTTTNKKKKRAKSRHQIDPTPSKHSNVTSNETTSEQPMDSTYDDFTEGQDGEPKKEFGFRASALDGSTNEDDKSNIEDEVQAFQDSIKVGEKKPNMTFTLDKSDVEGKDSTPPDLAGEDPARPVPFMGENGDNVNQKEGEDVENNGEINGENKGENDKKLDGSEDQELNETEDKEMNKSEDNKELDEGEDKEPKEGANKKVDESKGPKLNDTKETKLTEEKDKEKKLKEMIEKKRKELNEHKIKELKTGDKDKDGSAEDEFPKKVEGKKPEEKDPPSKKLASPKDDSASKVAENEKDKDTKSTEKTEEQTKSSSLKKEDEKDKKKVVQGIARSLKKKASSIHPTVKEGVLRRNTIGITSKDKNAMKRFLDSRKKESKTN